MKILGAGWEPAMLRDATYATVEKMLADGRLRIKPQLKKIDLSGLVRSGVLCEFTDDEFSNTGGNMIAHLDGVKNDYVMLFVDSDGANWKHCRPLFNHPHVHTGGPCPIPEGLVATATVADGSVVKIDDDFVWEWAELHSVGDRIIAYTITGIAEGYEKLGK